MSTCPICGIVLGPNPGPRCPNCDSLIERNPPLSPGAPAAAAAPIHPCPNCKTPMALAGELQFRVGGATGAGGFLLGNWNQLSEQLQPFSVYHCSTCGKVEFYETGR